MTLLAMQITLAYNGSMKKNITIILLLLIILLTASLSLANMQPVVVNYLFGTFKIPLILLILLSVFLGFVSHLLISLPKGLTHRQQVNQLKKQLVDTAKTQDTTKQTDDIDS